MNHWLVYLNLTVALISCQTLQPTPKPAVSITSVWDGKIFLGDTKQCALVRAQSGSVIKCDAPDFDRMVCMSLEDYTKMMEYFLQAACVNQ